MIKRRRKILRIYFNTCIKDIKSQKKAPEIKPSPEQPEIEPPHEPTAPPLVPERESPYEVPEIEPKPRDPEIYPEKEQMFNDKARSLDTKMP